MDQVTKRKCVICHKNAQLRCEKCYGDRIEAQANRRQVTAAETGLNSVLGVGIQYHEELVQSLNKKIATKTNALNRIDRLKQKIAEVKTQIVEQQETQKILNNIMKSQEQILASMRGDCEDAGDGRQEKCRTKKCNEESDVIELYSKQLLRKNQEMLNKVSFQLQDKFKILQKMLKIFKIEDKKFILQKYIKIEQTEKVLYATEGEDKDGIPYLLAQKQQIMATIDLGAVEDEHERNELEITIAQTIFFATKITALVHKIFFPEINLPYKLVASWGEVYIGNFQLSLAEFSSPTCKKFSKFGTQNFYKFLARLQANVQYLAWAVGYVNRPLLVLDEGFMKKLKENNFSTVGERLNKWQSRLRELKGSQILQEQEGMYRGFQRDQQIRQKMHKQEQEYQECELDEDQSLPQSLTAVISCEKSAQSQGKKSDPDSDDDVFEILE